MTRAGAAGATASEIDDVLHWTGVSDPHGGFNALDLLLAQRSGTFTRADGTEADVTLRVSNALWGQRDTTFEAGFLDLLAEQYGAGMRLVDFQADASGARREINDWVSDQTEDRIEDLIPEGALDQMTRLVLTNAVYLLAPWESPFVKGATAPGTFTRIDGSTVQAELMRQTARFPYATGEGWQAVEFPYAGGQLAMIVIVPDAGRFAEIEDGLDGSQLNQIGSSLEELRVDLRFPSFEFRTQAGLKPALEALGLDTAFDRQRADFSGMTSEERLFIADVLHEAFIAVDEEGTEAAAATAVVMNTMSAPLEPLEFLGRVMDPTR
jgi:serpin B